jgi:transposase
MNVEVYIQILEKLKPDLKERGLTLCHNVDSVHKSNKVKQWAKENHIDLLLLPKISPDLSIMETIAHPIKKKFHAQRCATQEQALAQFVEVWDNEVDQKKIQHCYDYYTKRLHDVNRVNGQMSQY